MPGDLKAVLLLGPTGSGKTPLGRELEERGLAGGRVFHFDFGAALRSVAADEGRAAGLDSAELKIVKDSLTSGTLLEDKEFPVALKVLRAFLSRRRAAPIDVLILNGLPRHEAQAERMKGFVVVRLVVVLEASAGVLRGRIDSNSGGDRAGRTDDAPADIEKKLALYERRTRPLIQYYRERGVPIISVEVGPDDTADDLYKALRTRLEVVL